MGKHKIPVFLLLVLCLSCMDRPGKQAGMSCPPPSVLEGILERGVLRMATFYNTTDYYTYKGITRGFHYDLAKDLAGYLNVRLQVTEVTDNVDRILGGLREGRYDIAATNLSVTPERAGLATFTPPFFHTDEVIVQQTDAPPVSRLEDLDGKEIYIPQSRLSTYRQNLLRLQDSLGIRIHIREVGNCTGEDLMHLVEKGRIGCCVTDAYMAQATSHSVHNIDYSLKLKEEIPIAWGLPQHSDLLHAEIGAWMDTIRRNGKLNMLYRRYFNNSKTTSEHVTKYELLKSGTISPFDDLLKREARRIGWDWRLLAAVTYNESQFNPEAESVVGAFGLMQIIPETADHFNVSDYFRADSNIYTGTSYLKYLDDYMAPYVPDDEERIKFVLASYNAGPGHILDAIRLAGKYGKSPCIWSGNVDYFIRHKDEPRFYLDSLAKNGYCKGEQTYRYVEQVMETYNNYRNIR